MKRAICLALGVAVLTVGAAVPTATPAPRPPETDLKVGLYDFV